MNLQRLQDALGGAIKKRYRKFTFADLTAAALTQQFDFAALPAGAIVVGIDVNVIVAFAGTTTLVLDLGDAGGAEYADDVDMQTAARTSNLIAVANSDGNGVVPSALFTATVEDVDASTAGEVEVAILYIDAQDVPKR